MNNQPILGKLIETNQQRDAIHIAVAPVIAVERLSPGQHIGFAQSGNVELVSGGDFLKVGIVDPFLPGPVFKGERFWMVLYPQTITSLRHDWTHPAFLVQANVAAPLSPADKAVSEKWLHAFADEWGMSYDDMVSDASTGEGLTAHGRDIHSWSELESGQEDDFWRHMEVVTGKQFSSAHRERTYFSCSC